MGDWPMSLDNLVGRGLQREPSDGEEVRRYLRRIASRLADARSDSISFESRFDLAYEALLQTGLVALRAHGYRVDSRGGHHVTALQTLNLTVGYPKEKLRLADQFRRQRSQGLYDGSFEPTGAEVTALIELTDEVKLYLHRWLEQHRPEWLDQ